MQFSVIIPVYNRASRIASTINSVLSQDFKDFELIIVNDGSTDDTDKVIRSFTDNRIRYYSRENGERGKARNYGTLRATGNYITFLDSDDLLYNDHLEKADLFISQHQQPAAFHMRYFIRTGNKLITPEYPEVHDQHTIMLGNYFSCQGMFLRKDIAKEYQFNEDRRLAGLEDWELWIRLNTGHPILLSGYYTSELTDHSLRSVREPDEQALQTRIGLLITAVTKNEIVKEKYQAYFAQFISRCYTYAALHLAMNGSRRSAIRYLGKAAGKYPASLFSRRFMAAIKYIFR